MEMRKLVLWDKAVWYPVTRHWPSRYVMKNGEYYEDKLLRFLHSIYKGGLVLDVGANIGNHTLCFAQHFGPTHAFEPCSDTFSVLNQVDRKNELGARLYLAACSDRPKTVFLNCPDPKDVEWYSCENYVSSLRTKKTIDTLHTITLDGLSLASPVGLIKIDTEGHELSVLHGARKILSEFKPIVSYEVTGMSKSDRLASVEMLQRLGYALVGTHGRMRTWKPS